MITGLSGFVKICMLVGDGYILNSERERKGENGRMAGKMVLDVTKINPCTYTVQLCLFSVQQPEVPVFTSVADPDPTNNIDADSDSYFT